MIRLISILGPDGSEISLPINLEAKENGGVRISWAQGDLTGEVSAGDYFDGLIEVREILDRTGLIPLCNGARYDVFPSRMSRQMGRGMKAYILTFSQQASNSDLVDIFDRADSAKIGTRQQQKDYYEGWLKSLV